MSRGFAQLKLWFTREGPKSFRIKCWTYGCCARNTPRFWKSFLTICKICPSQCCLCKKYSTMTAPAIHLKFTIWKQTLPISICIKRAMPWKAQWSMCIPQWLYIMNHIPEELQNLQIFCDACPEQSNERLKKDLLPLSNSRALLFALRQGFWKCEKMWSCIRSWRI